MHNTENVTEPHPILVNDLTPFSDYCISIQAFNALGGSNRASLVKVKTKAAGLFNVVLLVAFDKS